MIVTVLTVTAFILWASTNILMAVFSTGEEMYKTLIRGQYPIGLAANVLFYAPAWFLKGLRFVVEKTIA